MLSRTSLFALLGIGLLACGGDDPVVTSPIGDAGGDGSAALAIAPVNTVTIIDLAAKAGTAVTYKVTDGTNDVSSTAALTLDDPTLGTFAGPVFTSALGLPKGASVANTNVHATAAGRNVSTGLWLGALRKSGTHRDLLFTAAAGSFAPQRDLLQMQVTVNGVDVAFLVQSSGSMGGSMTNFQTALGFTAIPNLVKAIPSLNVGVADFVDYPVNPFGNFDDYPVKVRQVSSPTTQDSVAALQALKANGGSDLPSSALPAMHYLLTGEALTWPSGSLPAHVSPSGRFGGADFRSDAAAFVVAVTNTDWHDTATSPYSFTAPTMADVKKDFASTGVRYIGVTDISGSEAQANDLSDATKSNVPPAAFGGKCGVGQCCTGVSDAARAPAGPGGTCRLNFLTSGGAGFGTGVTTAIQAATYGAKYDVKVVLRNEPTNPGGVDATLFLKVPEALAAGDVPTGCVANPAKDTDADGVADTFTSVGVGTPVCFQFAPKAAITPAATDKPQLFVAYADVVGMPGNVKLDTRVVLFVVPAKN